MLPQLILIQKVVVVVCLRLNIPRRCVSECALHEVCALATASAPAAKELSLKTRGLINIAFFLTFVRICRCSSCREWHFTTKCYHGSNDFLINRLLAVCLSTTVAGQVRDKLII